MDKNVQAAVLPEILDLPNRFIQTRVNQIISHGFRAVMRDLDYGDPAVSFSFAYVVPIDTKGVLSLYGDIYAYRERAAHGQTIRRSYTFDLLTGRLYQLSDLFRKDSDYIGRISAIIKEQIEEREIPLIKPFDKITSDTGYYLTANELIVYFQAYEYTPGYVGIPEFSIPYTAIEGLVAPDSPINRLI